MSAEMLPPVYVCANACVCVCPRPRVDFVQSLPRKRANVRIFKLIPSFSTTTTLECAIGPVSRPDDSCVCRSAVCTCGSTETPTMTTVVAVRCCWNLTSTPTRRAEAPGETEEEPMRLIFIAPSYDGFRGSKNNYVPSLNTVLQSASFSVGPTQ